MSNFVLVLDQNKQPQNPVCPALARLLLTNQQAAVFRRQPFTIILKPDVELPPVQPLALKIDPGSQTTGIALVQGEQVIFGLELEHRGQGIRKALQDRLAVRRSRRHRKTRYRKPRFQNRRRSKGWLAPSLRHRVLTTKTWVGRLCRFAPVAQITVELVKFDMQAMQNPEIEGVEYQQGTLAGYEVREYLLEKWNRQCAYCGAEGVPLQIEHIQPRANGGSNRIVNLTLACHPCNTRKGVQPVETFLASQPDRLRRIKAQAQAPLKDAASVNATRWALYETLKEIGLPVRTGSGGQTKFHRTRLGLEKAHWIDAACVGEVQTLRLLTNKPLVVQCVGHGTRQMCRTDKYGFPRLHKSRTSRHFGFQTGDRVKAVVLRGKKVGTYVGKVACRASGRFNITTSEGTVQGIGYRYCSLLHRKDGYAYS